MNKILGIFGLLLFVCLFTAVMSDSFIGEFNLFNVARRSALFGILSIGVAFVIITGGIDLSIGSVVGLVACLLPMLVVDSGLSPPLAILLVLFVAGGIGLLHGLLITRLDLQPFVVTLCGLLFYRGFSRWLADDATLGFGQEFDGLRLLAIGKPFSWATLIGSAGAVLLCYGLWRAFRQGERASASDQLTARLNRWSPAGIGTLLLLVGSSRFWFGWESTPGVVLWQMAGYQARGLAAVVPESSTTVPGKLMLYLGAGMLAPLLILFLRWAWQQNATRVRWPMIGSLLSLVALGGCLWTLVPAFRESVASDRYRVGLVEMSGDSLRLLALSVCFVVVAATIGSLGWLVSAASKSSERSRALVPLLVTAAVFSLMGLSNLPATMVPTPMVLLIAVAVAASVFLNHTVYGRYLLALGRNEEAARYSGINTKRMTVLAYVLCALAAGLGGVLFSLESNAVQPSSFGNFYELYAIAAAVLGGCSLRGGEGNVLGVVIGAAVMRVLRNAINLLGISTKLEFSIIGLVILAGVIVDVVVRRIAERKRLEQRDTGADEAVPEATAP
ncbi:MAG: hypothetical protein AAFV88_05060 [Planctomycetota bacterium]